MYSIGQKFHFTGDRMISIEIFVPQLTIPAGIVLVDVTCSLTNRHYHQHSLPQYHTNDICKIPPQKL